MPIPNSIIQFFADNADNSAFACSNCGHALDGYENRCDCPSCGFNEAFRQKFDRQEVIDAEPAKYQEARTGSVWQ